MSQWISIDARWLADSGTSASWAYSLLVQPAVEDVDAAVEDGDWGVCIVASLLAIERMIFCELLLAGFRVRADEPAVIAAASNARQLGPRLHQVTNLRREEPTLELAKLATSLVGDADNILRGMLPIDLPSMRTPEGFFPSVRTASSLERLRETQGLGPFEFEWWGNIP